jgi:hypothetical protein
VRRNRIEQAVVSLRVDPPEARAADIGQARAEAIAEQAEQAEHHVAVGAGVGHDLRWLKVGLLFKHHGQQDQAVAQVPGTVMSFRPENWSEIRLYQVTPRPTPKYLGLGPACTVRTGTTKRMPSADATSPPPQRLASASALRRHQYRVGGRQRVVADIVLVHPGQAVALERRDVAANQRLRPVLQASAISTAHRLTWRSVARAVRSERWSEGVGEAGTCSDFQNQFGQVYARQHAGDPLPQCDQRGRFIQLVEWTEHQIVFVANLIETHRRVVGQAAATAR